MSSRPRRSCLYLPASNLRALEKAKTLDVDCLILDLEDAVAPDMKLLARKQAVEAVNAGGFGFREVIIRANSLTSEWGLADIEAICASKADGILIPKVNSADDIYKNADLLTQFQAPNALSLWAMMETSLAMINAAEIAKCALTPRSRLTTFVMGTNDLAKETKTRLVKGRLPMVPWLMGSLTAARAYGVTIIDGVYNEIKDEEGLLEECFAARDMGFDGKTLIHPSQIAPCHEAFTPSSEEVTFSREIIAAFSLPENSVKGVLQINGKMVEILHRDMALLTVKLAESIAHR